MKTKKLLLVGNPNVGKSVVFSRLTGVKVVASNYPGTTVEFFEGIMHIEHEDVKVIDVPGIYSLEATSKAEEVSVKMLEETFKDSSMEDSVIVNVIDSTNLERNLNVTLQLIDKGYPMVIALNMWDETKHTGIDIDFKQLESILDVPCIPTCAISGEGINDLVKSINRNRISGYKFATAEKWQAIGEIIQKVQNIHHRHHTIFQRFGELTLRPATGLVIAAVVAFFSFKIIRFLGESLIGFVFDPLFDNFWAPVVLGISEIIGSSSPIHGIFIGNISGGSINFNESLGLLTTGLYVPLAAVLPYIFSFYLILSFLEDSGYLPRLAVLLDNTMHRIGLHGYGIIPMILGLGCNVPGALSTRIMETKRERFLAAVIMAIAVPCMAQIAMVSSLVGNDGAKGFSIVFITLVAVWFILGSIMNATLHGHAPELFIEIPPYRLPLFTTVLKKVWMRILWFFKEALPWVLFGVFIVNVFYQLGLIDLVGEFARPVISQIMGLPKQAVGGLVIGFLRKDVAVGMLIPLNMTLKQRIIASVVLTMYFPCIATFSVMLREFGLVNMLKAASIMIVTTVSVAGLLNLILR